MKTLFRYILPALATIAIVSCRKDIMVKTPDVKDGLTLFSNPETGNRMWVQVGKSTSILKYNGQQDLSVTNAIVKMYVNGQYLQTLHYDQGLKLYLSDSLIKPGVLYKLTVEAQGYTTVEAEAQAPARATVTYVHVADTSLPLSGGGTSDYVAATFRFDDPGTTTDYYQLNFYNSMQVLNDDFQTSYECVNIKDPSIEEQRQDPFGGQDDCKSGDIVFTDELFNGKIKQLTASVNPYSAAPVAFGPGDSTYAIFKLTHLSADRFKYLTSYKKAQQADGNPFAEPVNVYTNVKNGHGIFSISQPAVIVIKQ